MQRKMTRLARAAKCGGLGASGLAALGAVAGFFSAAQVDRPAKARYPKPEAAVFSAVRRDRMGKFGFMTALDVARVFNPCQRCRNKGIAWILKFIETLSRQHGLETRVTSFQI